MGNNKVKLITILIVLLAVISLVFGIVSAKHLKNSNADNHQLKIELASEQKQNNSLKRKLSQKDNDLLEAQNEAKSAETKTNNNDSHKIVNKQFNDIASNLIKVLYDYSPANFKDRKAAAQNYMTDSAYTSFFPKNVHMGDTSYVTSKVGDIKVYNKAVQNDQFTGLITVSYKSKYQNQAYNHGQAFYEVKYDTHAKKISSIKLIDNKSSED